MHEKFTYTYKFTYTHTHKLIKDEVYFLISFLNIEYTLSESGSCYSKESRNLECVNSEDKKR